VSADWSMEVAVVAVDYEGQLGRKGYKPKPKAVIPLC